MNLIFEFVFNSWPFVKFYNFGALVAVHEGVVLHDAEGIGRGQIEKAWRSFVGKHVPGPGQGAVQQLLVPHAPRSAMARSAMIGDQAFMDRQDHSTVEPDRVQGTDPYLASSRRALRLRRMPSSASSICLSNSGS